MSATLSEEQLLLTRSEAEALLRSLDRPVLRVVRVCDDDAILFLALNGRPWTAWLSRLDGDLACQFEQGWPAEFNACSRVSAPVRPPQPQLPEHTD